MAKISLCTGCMDRKEFLDQTIQTWMKLPFNEILILDWDSKEGLRGLIDKYQDGRLKLLEIRDKKYYHINKVRNTVISYSKNQYVLMIDPDIKLREDFLEKHILSPSLFYHGDNTKSKTSGTVGTCFFHRRWFDLVGGYNERMEGAGSGDWCFYRRVKNAGALISFFFLETLYHIQHDNSLTVQNYKEKDIQKSHLNNKITMIRQPWSCKDIKEINEINLYK